MGISDSKRASCESLLSPVHINDVYNLSKHNSIKNISGECEEGIYDEYEESKNSMNANEETGSEDKTNEEIKAMIPQVKCPKTANYNSSKNTGRDPEKSILEGEIKIINNPLIDYHRKARALVSTGYADRKAIKKIKKFKYFNKLPKKIALNSKNKIMKNNKDNKNNKSNKNKDTINYTHFSKLNANTDFIKIKENKKYQSLQNSQIPEIKLKANQTKVDPQFYNHHQRKLYINKENIDFPKDQINCVKSIKSCRILPQKIIIPGKTINSKLMPGLFLGFSKNHSENNVNPEHPKFHVISNKNKNSQYDPNHNSCRYKPYRIYEESNSDTDVIENSNENEISKQNGEFIDPLSNLPVEEKNKYAFFKNSDFNSQIQLFKRKLNSNKHDKFSELISNPDMNNRMRVKLKYVNNQR